MFLKTKEEIKEWLDYFNIENYIINEDLTVDVNGGVYLFNKNLTNIPVKFNIITGYFYCHINKLATLKFSPEKVGGDFTCAGNKLITLQGAPKEVTGSFYCSYNELTSLQGAPKDKLKEIITDYPNLIRTLSTEDLLEIV